MPRRPELALAFSTLLAASPLTAQETAAPQPPQRPGLAEVFTAETVGSALLTTALSWARFLADIRFDQASFDPIAMRAVLTGVDISPFIPDMPPRACVITAQRMVIAGAPLDTLTSGRFRVSLDGAAMASGCLPLDAANMLRGTGFTTVSLPRAELDYRYDYASGGAQLALVADVERLAELHLDADLAYVSYRMNFDREEPMVALDLSHAEMSLRDKGGWTLLQRFVFGQQREPAALTAMFEGGVTEILTDANRPGQDLSKPQTEFAATAGRLFGNFSAGDTFVLATRIDNGPVHIDERSARAFRKLFAALNPALGPTSPRRGAALPVAALQAALNGQAASPEDAFANGRALITGVGAPRNIGAGLKLLAPLARSGNAEASLLIARAVETARPADAYAHALRAAAANLPGALALLDRIERDLPYADILSKQNGLMGPVDESLYGDLPAMRRAARDYLIGTARPRAWRAAYFWSSMAAAAGDPSGASLRAEITEAIRLRGDAEAWRAEAERLDNAVLSEWIGRDIPAALR